MTVEVGIGYEICCFTSFWAQKSYYSKCLLHSIVAKVTSKGEIGGKVKIPSRLVGYDAVMICANCGALLKDESEKAQHEKVCPGIVQGRC
jgi:hypothetical protein